jgi:tol-pal system protein YbgF
MRRLEVLATVLTTLALPACSGNLAAVETELRELRTRVDEVARTGTSARIRLEDIENRVLLLQDEIETQRIAGMRDGSRPVASAASAPSVPSSLPVVRLSPPSDPAPAESERPARARKPAPAATPPAELGDGYSDIDENGRVLSGRGSRTASVSPAPREAPKPRARARQGAADDPTALADYRAAYESYEQGRTDEAIALFRAFVQRYERHPYADNAQYWIGECLYDRKDFDSARREFLRVVSEHPDGNKVPDAMVKVGLCNQMLQQPEEARRMFDAVMLTYPDSPAASVAMRLLGEMP